MFRKVLILTAIIIMFLACELQADVTHSTWVGGSQGEWGKASNWSPRIVPDNTSSRTFAVTIDSNSIGVDEVCVFLNQSRTINQLDCYGEVFLTTWSHDWVELALVGPNGLTNYDALEIEELNLNGKITNNPGSYIDLVGLEIDGNIYNLAGGTIEAEWDCCVDGAVENAGSMVIAPAGELNVENHFNNLGEILMYGGELANDDILDNNDTGLIKGFGVIYAEQLLRNKGQIYAYGGSLAVSVKGALINTGTLGNLVPSSLHIMQSDDLNNHGRIEVHAGGGVGIDCNLVNQPNGVIQLLGGSLGAQKITQRENAAWQGFGGISVYNEIQVESGAKIKLTGPTNVVGDVNIPENARLEISDGTTLITGHTTNNGIIRVVNGDVIFQGGYSGSGVVQKD